MQVIGMGKIVTVYLTDEEAKELKQFCEENQCTQYSAMKTALKEILFKPMKETEETPLLISKQPSARKWRAYLTGL